MNKKFLFSFFIMLFSGLCLGYAINGCFLTKRGESSRPVKDDTFALHRFGDKRNSLQTERKTVEKRKEIPLDKADSYFLQLSKMDVEETWAEIGRICKTKKSIFKRSPIEKLALSFLYSRLGEKSPRQALEQIKNSTEYVIYSDHILQAWAERNPETAMNYCLENKDPENEYYYARIIARTSPEKAMEWIKALPKKKKEDAVYGLVLESFKTHPEKIGEIIQQAGTLVGFDPDFTASTAGQWVISDKEAAMKWINSLPEEQQIEARASALKELPLEEATAALATLEGKAKEAAIIQIASSLGYDHPLQAVEWLMTHVDSDMNSWKSIVDSVYSIGSHANNPDLQAYLIQLPSGEKKDIFMEKMVNSLIFPSDELEENDMNKVLSLVSQISNAEKRTSSTESTLKSWTYRAPEEARQWIEKSDWTEEKKKEFYKYCDICEKEKDDLFK